VGIFEDVVLFKRFTPAIELCYIGVISPPITLILWSDSISLYGSNTGWYVSHVNEKFNLISVVSLVLPNVYVEVLVDANDSGKPTLAWTTVPL